MSADTSKQDSQRQEQLDLQKQQQDQENAILQQNRTALAPYLTGNNGFTTQQLAALHSAANDQNALRYNQATQQANAAVAARGENGLTPLSGVATGMFSNLAASRASDLADANRTITLNDAQQALANKFNALGILSGNAQTYAGNVGTYGSGASSALSNLTQAQQGGFFNTLARGFGSGLGSSLGGAVTGGFGTALSKVGDGSFGW